MQKFKMEKINDSRKLLDPKKNYLEVRVLKLTDEKLSLVIEDNYLYLIGKNQSFVSSEQLSLYYAYRKLKKSAYVSFQLYSLENEPLIEFVFKERFEQYFRFLFTKYLIHTDFDVNFKLTEKLSEEGFSINYFAELKWKNAIKVSRFLVKRFSKQRLYLEQKSEKVFKTVHRMFEISTERSFFDVFMLFESDNHFFIVFETKNCLLLNDFVKLNKIILSYQQLIDIILQIADSLQALEKKGYQIPFLKLDSIMVCKDMKTYSLEKVSKEKSFREIVMDNYESGIEDSKDPSIKHNYLDPDNMTDFCLNSRVLDSISKSNIKH